MVLGGRIRAPADTARPDGGRVGSAGGGGVSAGRSTFQVGRLLSEMYTGLAVVLVLNDAILSAVILITTRDEERVGGTCPCAVIYYLFHITWLSCVYVTYPRLYPFSCYHLLPSSHPLPHSTSLNPHQFTIFFLYEI